MKRSAMAALLAAGLFLLAAGSSAQAASLKCSGAGGKMCSAQQVAALNQGIVTGQRMHRSSLISVRGVTQGPNGMLVCTQDNGAPCTDQQLDAIVGLASSTHSSDGEIVIVKEVDKASPL